MAAESRTNKERMLLDIPHDIDPRNSRLPFWASLTVGEHELGRWHPEHRNEQCPDVLAASPGLPVRPVYVGRAHLDIVSPVRSARIAIPTVCINAGL